MAELDADIERGTKNLLLATDNQDLLNRTLTEWRDERSRVKKELAEAEAAAAVPVDEVRGRVLAALESLWELRTRLLAAWTGGQFDFSNLPREEFGEMVRRMVARIDLFFEARPLGKGKRTKYTLVKHVLKPKRFMGLGEPGAVPGSVRSGR